MEFDFQCSLTSYVLEKLAWHKFHFTIILHFKKYWQFRTFIWPFWECVLQSKIIIDLECVKICRLVAHSYGPPKVWIFQCQLSLKHIRASSRGHNKSLLVVKQIFHGDIQLWKLWYWPNWWHCCNKLHFSNVPWETCGNGDVGQEDCWCCVEFHWTVNASVVEKVEIVFLDKEPWRIPRIWQESLILRVYHGHPNRGVNGKGKYIMVVDQW